MKIGFVGLGKLGYPVAAAMAYCGHNVKGYDINPEVMSHGPRPYKETGPDGETDFNKWFPVAGDWKQRFTFGSLEEVANHGDIIFVAVQTPHDERYEGITPMPEERVDFDYYYLKQAISALAEVVRKPTIIAVISTVLPGTMRRVVMPLMNDNMRLVYNPSFIAMGTTMRDFLEPEFVLIGADNHVDGEILSGFYYDTFVNRPKNKEIPPRQVMSIESAELTKVAYNTYISQKITFANTVMEICHKIPEADCDEVIDALSLASRRLISPAYLRGGMGDGGGCHPRDNIAMSHIARRLDLHYDIFDAIMMEREEHAFWLAEMMCEYDLPKCILGYAFKPETNLIVGSHALLVRWFLESLERRVVMFDQHVGDSMVFTRPHVFLVGCKHSDFKNFRFPHGSVVIDPFRYIPDQEGVEVVRLGERVCH